METNHSEKNLGESYVPKTNGKVQMHKNKKAMSFQEFHFASVKSIRSPK